MNTSNIDITEVEKFNKLAQDWWDLSGPMAMLHVINPLRVNFIKQNADIAGKKILDVGCGAGILTEALSKAGGILTGLELSPRTLAVAKQHAKSEHLSINYFQEDIETFQKNHQENHQEKFDVITCLEVLEHVPDPKRIIDTCTSLLKPGGHLFLSTINRNLKSYIFAIIGAEYILKLLPKGTHSYKKLIRPSELIQMAKANGFELKRIESFCYNPFFKTFKTKVGADVNYIACFGLGDSKL